ncbi:MAG: sigma-54-dependent Fis family transcriptional regulator, partial [Phycisphaerales bacterium]|nr:sigma-54-dependent Fis family transcriptional regulator [Phycisphaerales bacterium]
PRLDGMGLLQRLRQDQPEVEVIVLTAHGTVDTALQAMKLGAFDYIQKPFESDAIAIVIERAAAMGRLRGENETLRATLETLDSRAELIGDSRAMRHVRAQIDKVAQSQATVLIQGESGTGKELVARSIHEASQRATGAMLCVNCAALSPTLLESELFGHERGAFTGADRLRKGRFELAADGTLLLDEISEVSMPVQAKLLRVIEDGEVRRIGARITRRTDVRVIATTNRDLSEWVARRRFREDLFFRISVLPITLPPLRDRRDDIPQLVEYFLKQIAIREGREALAVTTRAMSMLESYHWPGNIRELQNICERAAVLCQSEKIDGAMIEPWLMTPDVRLDNLQRPLRPGHLMEDMERALIEQTLVKFNGHREKTAKSLGIGVRTLGMKLKRWREEAAAAAQNQRLAG